MNRRREGDVDEYHSPVTAPWWLTAVYRLGPITAIALFLIWFVTHNVETQIQGMQGALQNHIDDMKQEQLSSHFYLRAICLNTSVSEKDRANCLSAPPSPVERASSFGGTVGTQK